LPALGHCAAARPARCSFPTRRSSDLSSRRRCPRSRCAASSPCCSWPWRLKSRCGRCGIRLRLRFVVASLDDIWLPLVDEPIGGIVARLEADDPELGRLVGSPRRLLAFRTFAYIRIGIVLGQLLFEDEIEPYDGSDAWVETLLGNPAH